MLNNIHVGDEVKKIQDKPKLIGNVVYLPTAKRPTTVVIGDGIDHFFSSPSTRSPIFNNISPLPAMTWECYMPMA